MKRYLDQITSLSKQVHGLSLNNTIRENKEESLYEQINPRSSSQLSNRSGFGTINSISSSFYSTGSYHQNRSRSFNEAKPSGLLNKKNYRTGNEAKNGIGHFTNLLVHSMANTSNSDVLGEKPIIGVCQKCKETVFGDGSGCIYNNQIYHTRCFTCCICDRELQGMSFYAIGGHPYCENDYLNTLEKCSICNKPIPDRIIRATGKPYHPDCFTCIVCGKCLDGIPFTVDSTNRIHCIEDFHRKFAPRCCVCKGPIMPQPGQMSTVRVVALDRSFHIECYKCEDCGLILSSEAEGRGCYPLDDHVLCRDCNATRVRKLTA